MKGSWRASGASAMLGLALLACGGKRSTAPDASGAAGDTTGPASAHGGSTQDGAGPPGGSLSETSETNGASGASGEDAAPPGDLPCLVDPRVPPCKPIEGRPLPGPRPSCPEAEPTVGAPCSEPDLVCGYGDAGSPACRGYYQCAATGWVRDPRMNGYRCDEPPTGYCPAEPPPTATACTPVPSRSSCVYADVSCRCVDGHHWATPGDGWICYGPPRDPLCPLALPNIGEGCSTPGVQCSYWEDCDFPPYSTVFCYSGAWEEGERGTPCQL